MLRSRLRFDNEEARWPSADAPGKMELSAPCSTGAVEAQLNLPSALAWGGMRKSRCAGWHVRGMTPAGLCQTWCCKSTQSTGLLLGWVSVTGRSCWAALD